MTATDVDLGITLGLLLAIAGGVGLIVDGLRDRARRCAPSQPTGAASLPTPRSASVEAGEIAAADPTYRESVAVPPHRVWSAAAAIDSVAAPRPYNAGAVRK